MAIDEPTVHRMSVDDDCSQFQAHGNKIAERETGQTRP
jgi:hypothetical protein